MLVNGKILNDRLCFFFCILCCVDWLVGVHVTRNARRSLAVRIFSWKMAWVASERHTHTRKPSTIAVLPVYRCGCVCARMHSFAIVRNKWATQKTTDDVACGVCVEITSKTPFGAPNQWVNQQSAHTQRTYALSLALSLVRCVPNDSQRSWRELKQKNNISEIQIKWKYSKRAAETRTHTDFASLCKYFIQQIKMLSTACSKETMNAVCTVFFSLSSSSSFFPSLHVQCVNNKGKCYGMTDEHCIEK